MKKFLRFSFMILAAMAFTMQAAAEEASVVFNQINPKINKDNTSFNSLDGAFTFTVAQGEGTIFPTLSVGSIQLNDGNSLMVKSVKGYKMTAIKFTCRKNVYASTKHDAFDFSSGEWTVASRAINWTGNTDELTLTNTYGRLFTVAQLDITYSSETTGINVVKTVTLNTEAPIYNLAGQRVGNDYKGVVIQNGRKYLKK